MENRLIFLYQLIADETRRDGEGYRYQPGYGYTRSKRVGGLQKEQYELFLHKQHDYGPGNISVGTMLQTPEEIKLSLTGLWFRMNDKLQRVKTLLMHGRESAVKDEPLEDAYLDVSNYGIMATIVKNGKWGK